MKAASKDTPRWPDGTPKSMDNAFTRRETSGFATPQEIKKVAAKMGGQKRQIQRQAAREIPTHPVMDGLSERARRELTAAPPSMPLSTKADTLRTQRIRKARV